MKQIRLHSRQRGVTALEYAILAAALAATLFAVAGSDGPLSEAIKSAFNRVEQTIENENN